MTRSKEKLIDDAVLAASLAGEKSSTQINSFITMIRSDQSVFGVKKLMLYISRQMGRKEKKQPILNEKFGKQLLETIGELSNEENPSTLVENYLTFIKWSYEALKDRRDPAKGKELKGLNDLIKVIKEQ